MPDIPLSSSVVFNALEDRVDALEAVVATPVINNITTIATITGGNMASLSAYASLSAAIAAIGSAKVTLLIDSDQNVATLTTVPANVILKQYGTAKLTKTSTGAIVFQGVGLDNPMSLTPLFSGFTAGDITFTGTDYPTEISVKLWAGDDAVAWNSASLALSGKHATLHAYPATINSQVTIESYQTLKTHRGTYTMNTTGDSGSIWLKDHTNVIGDGWDTIFIETDTTANVGAWTTIFGMYNNHLVVPPASVANTEITTDVHISDIQFYGLRTNINDGGSQATISFGNAHYFSVRRCWFNSTTGYAANIGGAPDNLHHAENGWFTDNLVEGLFVQYLGLINLENVNIEHNIFKNPGRPFTITNATNASPIVITTSEANQMKTGNTVRVGNVLGNTAANGMFVITRIDSTHFSLNSSTGNGAYTSGGTTCVEATGVMVDVEPNGSTDEHIYNLSISNNLFDFRNTLIGFSAISYNITAPGIPNRGGKINNNVIIGNDATALGILYNAITVSDYSVGVEVVGNYTYGGSQLAAYFGGTNNNVVGNTFIKGGGGGNHSIEFSGFINSVFQSNTILGGPANGWEERGTNTNNTFAHNIVGDGTTASEIVHITGSTVTGSRYIGNVVYGSTSSGITESTNSNSNLYDNNMTNPVSGGHTGLTIVGGSSKMITHKYTDGTLVFGTGITIPDTLSYKIGSSPVVTYNAGTGHADYGVTGVQGRLIGNPFLYLINGNFTEGSSTTDHRLASNIQLAWSNTSNDATATADTGFARSASGVVKVTDGSTGIRGFLGGGAAVASATALPLPTGNVFHVTGTTTITSITATNLAAGVVITLIFDGALTFTDGNNLKLAGNFVTTADDTITLAYDGTNFYEIARSVN